METIIESTKVFFSQSVSKKGVVTKTSIEQGTIETLDQLTSEGFTEEFARLVMKSVFESFGLKLEGKIWVAA